MDPNATVQAIDEALRAGDIDEAYDLMLGLRWWRRRGGFEPACGWARVDRIDADLRHRLITRHIDA